MSFNRSSPLDFVKKNKLKYFSVKKYICYDVFLNWDMDGDLRENWSLFKLSWTNYADATRIDTKPAKVKLGTFLSIVGKECLKMIKNLPMIEEERVDINSTIKKIIGQFRTEIKYDIRTLRI